MNAVDPNSVCANCGTALIDEYCHACGQKRFVESDRRFGHLLHQFFASATDLDSRLWRTLRALLFQPGLLSREYFEGRRKRWLSPVSLFLTVSVVFFVAPYHPGDFAKQFFQQVSLPLREQALAPGETLTKEDSSPVMQFHSSITDAWIEARVRERDATLRKASPESAGYTMHDYRLAYDAKADDISKVLVILHVPFAALALSLAFARSRRYFAEHFVFALHFFSFELIALGVVLQIWSLAKHLPVGWQPHESVWDWIMRTLIPLYVILAMRRAYAVNWAWAIAASTIMLAVVLAANIFVYRFLQFAVTFVLT